MQTDVIGTRRAEPSELELLPNLIGEGALAQGSVGSEAVFDEVAFDVATWVTRLKGEKVFTYVVEQRDIFGFVTAGSAELDDHTIGEIIGLYLRSNQRRKGIGRKLLVRGLSILKLRDFEKALVFVDQDSQGVIGLLTGLGFEPSNYQRTINTGDIARSQVGYVIDLTGYF